MAIPFTNLTIFVNGDSIQIGRRRLPIKSKLVASVSTLDNSLVIVKFEGRRILCSSYLDIYTEAGTQNHGASAAETVTALNALFSQTNPNSYADSATVTQIDSDLTAVKDVIKTTGAKGIYKEANKDVTKSNVRLPSDKESIVAGAERTSIKVSELATDFDIGKIKFIVNTNAAVVDTELEALSIYGKTNTIGASVDLNANASLIGWDLGKLSDVTYTSLSDGQFLKYVNATGLWVNTRLSAVATSGAYSDLTGTPSLSAVATSGSYADLSSTPTIPVDLTSDGAGTIHANNVPTLNQSTTGNAATATALATARAINGVDFDGTAPITITAAGSTLSDTVTVAKGGTGTTTLASNSVLTGNGASAITAESNLTFDGSNLVVTGLEVFSFPDSADQYHGEAVNFGTGPGGVDGQIEQGKMYYLDSSQQWEETDANAASTSSGMIGIAVVDDIARFLVRGFARHTSFSGLTTGDILYLSATTGEITNVAPSGNGDIVRVVGYCVNSSTRVIYFDPDKTFVEVTA